MQLSKPLLEVSTFSFLPWSLFNLILLTYHSLCSYLSILNKPCLMWLVQAVIHLESIQSSPKRIDYLDALVEKFITPNPENPNITSATEREELSCIFLEVNAWHWCCWTHGYFVSLYLWLEMKNFAPLNFSKTPDFSNYLTSLDVLEKE